ncbi:MAG: uncharacterized protein PWR31_2094 [Bacillota bacterium]|nr:uncharacterized protein [Bacillota bacterium]
MRGEQRDSSDIDILVEFNEPIGLLRFVPLKYHLSELTGKDVDLVMKTALRPSIRKQVLKEGIYL